LGTPEALIAQDSLQLVWQIELDPWGQTQREYNPNNMLQPIRMQGQQLDAETGLFYNRYRYYDPAGGRYVTQDPIGLLGGRQLYPESVTPIPRVP
jgi:RHS repeat-associated protein